MHILAGLIGIVAAAAYWIFRMRAAAEMTHELMGVASDVVSAAKRFAYKKRRNEHPVDSIDTPELALAALGAGFLELGSLPTREQRTAMIKGLAQSGHMTLNEAEEITVLARWIVTEAGGPRDNMERLAKRLKSMSGADRFPQMIEMFQSIAQAGDTGLNDHQRTALDDVKTAFGLS